MPQIPATRQQSETLRAILAIVQSWVKPDSRTRVHSYFLAQSARAAFEAYVEIDDLDDHHRNAAGAKRYRNSPGIPLEALAPEKVEAIAKWVANQIYRQRPEWFIVQVAG